MNALKDDGNPLNGNENLTIVVRSWTGAIELYMVFGANKITCIPSTRFQHVFGLILVLVVSVRA